MWNPFSSLPSDHYSPHRYTTFEGYYSKFRLPSGASIALIISWIPGVAKDRDYPRSDTCSSFSSKGESGVTGAPYLIIFAYVTKDGRQWFLKEYTPETLSQGSSGKDGRGFLIKWDQGEFEWDGQDVMRWDMNYPTFRFSSSTATPSDLDHSLGPSRPKRVPWDPSSPSSTPAGFLADLPLPIQWHVHSVDSACTFSLSLTTGQSSDPSREPDLPPIDQKGLANVHLEKNWALTFPPAYIWIQARDHTSQSGVCVAGGSLFKDVQAFLTGYQARSGRFVSFMPPSASSIYALSLGLTTNIDYAQRKAVIDIRGWFTRLTIIATAPEDTFFPLSAPLSTGHATGYTVQSYGATVECKVWNRGWLGGWTEIKEEGEVWEGGSLEFGGDYYKAHQE